MPNLDMNLLVQRCPHCNVDNPNLTQTTTFLTKAFDGQNERHWGIYICQRCGGVVSAYSRSRGGIIREMFPSPLVLDDAIPPRAKAYLDQAIASKNAPAGAIMLSASSVDSMLKEKGYKDGNLYSRIDKAVKEHLITKEMSEWAHQVRLDANDQRHADEGSDLPKEKDAIRVIDFVIALAQFLFVMPSRVQSGIQESKVTSEGTKSN